MALIREYAGPIRRLCCAYAPGTANREDLFQEVFLSIWRSLPMFRGESSERTWLYRIAHNVAITWQVKNRRVRSRETVLEGEWQSARAGTDVRLLDLTRAIAQLRPADRGLILLWLEGLTAAEIEGVTGVAAGTVAVRLSRIRKQLKVPEVET